MKYVLNLISIAMCILLSGSVYSNPSSNSTEAPIQFEFAQLFSLLPVDDLKAIAKSHATNDTGFRAAIKYLQSSEWSNLLSSIKQKPEWKSFQTYLNNSGINIESAIKYVIKFLNDTEIQGNVSKTDAKNLKPFLIDIQQALPTNKIIAFINQKFILNSGYKALYEKLANEEFHKIVDNMAALPEVQRLVKTLMEMGLNLNELFSFAYTLLGWKKTCNFVHVY